MKSNFKLIGTTTENDKEYRVYRDIRTNKVYRINDSDVAELDDRKKEIALVMEESDNKIKAHRKAKRRKRFFAALLCLGLFGIGAVEICKQNKTEIEYILEEDSFTKNFNYLSLIVESNTSLTKENKNILLKYIKALVNHDIKEGKVLSIGQKIKKCDFSEIDLNNKEEVLEFLDDVLSLNDAGFVAAELYAYVNNTEVSEDTLLIANLFAFNKEVTADLLNGVSLESVINDLFGEIINTKRLSDLDKNKLRSINDYLNTFIIDTEGNVLDFQLHNNIFSEYVTIRYFDTIDIYGKTEGNRFVNYSDEVYFQRLFELVLKEGEQIDYSNPDDRMLVYLYANSRLGFIENDDPTSFLFNGTGEENLLPVIEREALYEYFTSGTIDYERLLLLNGLILFGEEALPVLQEVNLCLKEEVKCGNLKKSAYDDFIETICDFYKGYNMELYEKFVEAALKNESIDGYKLKLFNNNSA